MSDSALENFHGIVAELDYPMVVVTADVDGERSGCLVGFHNQASIDPARWWIGISKKNHTFGVARRAAVLTVHFLSADDVALARKFGERTGDEVDKFAACRWHPGPDGVPVIDDCANWAVVRIVDHADGGDHMGFITEPVDARGTGPFEPLRYQHVKDFHAGHEA